MRAYLPDYELQVPKNLKVALKLLSEKQGWVPFAGGTDLMVLFEAGSLPAGKYLSICELKELKGIRVTNEHVTLGALSTYTELRRDPVLQREFPNLCAAAAQTGAVSIQNRGTIGGNIANASPAADSPPALLVYGAELELMSTEGTRWVPYETFHKGYKKTELGSQELISRVRLRRGLKGWRHYYRKVGTRNAQAISKVVFAGMIRQEKKVIQEVRIGLGSVAPTVVGCRKTCEALKGKVLDASTLELAKRTLASEISPINDIRSTAVFRSAVAQNLLEEFLSGVSR